MRFHRYGVLILLSFCLSGSGCSKKATDSGTATTSEGRPPVAVEAAPAALGEITDSVEVVGTLVPKFEAAVKTEYTGIVTEVYVTEWVRVQKGRPLARLDSREVEAELAGGRAAVLQAEVAAQRGEREFARAVKLRAAGLATQQQLDDARTEREAAAALHEAARARLQVIEARLAKAIIRAPMGGVIAERAVNVGDLVENMGNPHPMFRIVDNRLLQLMVTVPAARLAELRIGQPLTFGTDGIPGRVFRGRVQHINPATEEASRTVKLIVEVPNPREELKAGLFVQGRLLIGTRRQVLQIRQSALLNWDVARQHAAVFVIDGETARRREVGTGAVAGELVEIRSGLTNGEAVVTGGGFNLRDADRVRVTPRKEG